MRIAVSGSHRVGKTTLVLDLTEALPQYVGIPEPYHLLEEEGHAFPDMPSIEDFEQQMELSCRCVKDSDSNVIFDRCPLDMLGYLITHPDADALVLEDWMPRVQESVAKLDRIVFVPIEEPDRIAVSLSEAPLRAEVDAVLRDILVDDAYGLGLPVITTTGTEGERLRQVMVNLR